MSPSDRAAAAIKAKVEDPVLVKRRRAALTRVAIACFSERGYHATTIRHIAERAQVSIGLIYQYVEDKEDLLFLALEEVLSSYRRQIPLALENLTDPLERFSAALRCYCRINDASIDATVLAYRETKSLRRDRRALIKRHELETNRLIAACIADCIAAGVFAPVDIELLTYQIVMFSHAWALKAWHFAGRMTVEDYVDRGLHLMLNPILTRDGSRRMDQLNRDRCG